MVSKNKINKRKRDEAFPLTRNDETKQPESSFLVKNTEISFPRGGASALTPIELKQVANEAASDALFDKEGTDIKERPKKKKQTYKVKSSQSTSKTEEQVSDVIEHISFKTLMPGSQLLGQISSVNKTDLCISITDSLCGYVSLANISEEFNSILEQLDNDMENNDDDDDEYDYSDNEDKESIRNKDLPNLRNFFKEGQWLRCVVQTNSALDSSSKSKRIQLSIEPSIVNQFMINDLSKHSTVQCSIKSIEDHGATLELGIKGITGFISNKDLSSFPTPIPGSVFLANIFKTTERTVNVNFDFSSKNTKVSHISSIDAVVPGQIVDFLCDTVTNHGIVGKVFGLMDGFLGISHLKTFSVGELKHNYSVGSNIRVRIIATLITKKDNKVVIASTLSHILSLKNNLLEFDALEAFPIGYIFESCSLAGRDSEYLYTTLDNDRIGQIHISKTCGDKLDGKFRARVIGYNTVDNYYLLSMDDKILECKYLRPQDIPLGEIISDCELISVSNKGIHLKIFNGQFTAFVPPLHISDIKLVFPERKFKVGSKLKIRIINVDHKKHIIATLKKSLVNIEKEDIHLVSSFQQISELFNHNGKTLATVEKFKPNGCIVSFLGRLKGFLPKGEISEAFVKKPQDHLRLGQTITVKILSHIEVKDRIIVTCKLSQESADKQKNAIENMELGRSIITVSVIEKTKDSVVVELDDAGLRGVIYAGHLSDKRIEDNRAKLKTLKLGSKLTGLVIDKDPKTYVFNLSCKESMIKDAEKGLLPISFNDIKCKPSNLLMNGYIKSISEKGVFVAFNGQFVGLVLPSYATENRTVDIFKKFYVNQSVSCYLLRTDEENERFLLSLKAPVDLKDEKDGLYVDAINPIDPSIKYLSDFNLGRIIKVKIKSVKRNQLNITLADNLYGRVDVSEIYDSFDDIKDVKNPLSLFKKGDIFDAKIIGYHDAKTHKFLPISHQTSNKNVLELSIRPSKLRNNIDSVSFDSVKIGDTLFGFVNNFSSTFTWLTISPLLKAKISNIDLTDDSSAFDNGIENSFPLGSVIKVKVTAIDKAHHNITVSGRSHAIKTYDDIDINMQLPARVVKVTDSYLLLALSDDVIGVSFITDSLDDYSVSFQEFFKDKVNSIVSTTVITVNPLEKKLRLSLRSSQPKDRSITSCKDLSRGDIVRGFIKNITDKGIFVYLSTNVQAFVPVSKLTDSFIRDWKKFYKPMQLVTGKVINCEDDSRIMLTTRDSEVNGELNILKGYSDIHVGDIFGGFVKNVTDFGVFIKLDNTLNVTGLAHKSEIADTDINDPSLLFGEGDKVKAIVLKTNPEKKQVSLGLKASYFKEKTEINERNTNILDPVQDEDESDKEEVIYDNIHIQDSDSDNELKQKTDVTTPASINGLSLSTNFDWVASILDQSSEDESSEEDFTENKRSRKSKKHQKKVIDKTVDINSRAPESIADFERLILGNPNSSVIWMNYMAFQLQLSEIDKAREIAERALKTINFREESEKLNIWISMLNLENTFGTDETLDVIFKRACQQMDSFTIHSKLIHIYQMSGKYEKTLELFRLTAKKFGSEKVSIWVSWSEFLMEQKQINEAREILSTALKSLHKRDHVEVVRKFAQLEFSKGDAEQARSLFEGLLADAPKRIDLWNVYIDQEIKLNEKKKVEELFERVISKKITRKQAKFFFNKWLSFEESKDDQSFTEYVKAKAAKYVEKYTTSNENGNQTHSSVE